jgi:GNAT superfamily N-acetyltransferase
VVRAARFARRRSIAKPITGAKRRSSRTHKVAEEPMRVFRKLLPTELVELKAHLLRLSPDDRVARFSGHVGDQAIGEHCARLDWRKSAVIGFFDGGVLRGAAEVRWEDPRLDWRAEVAVTVEEAWQDAGIGTELMRRAVVVCRNRSLKSIYMICLLDNRRMQRIARKFEGSLEFADGQVEADIKLPFPTQVSLVEEAFADGAGFIATWWDRIERRAGTSAV